MKRSSRYDLRFTLLLVSIALTASTFLHPSLMLKRPVHAYLFVVDITRSMNAEDYNEYGRPISRLDLVKSSLRVAIRDLPCGSRAGLALFTERNSAILFMPVEVCDNFSPIAETISRLDWRMAWAADSNIAQGLYNTIRLVKDLSATGKLHARLVFLTDGHEAPPVSERYSPDFRDLISLTGEVVPGAVTLAEHTRPRNAPRFEGAPAEVAGLIVGVGGMAPIPIPKYDEEGAREGFYAAGDVAQAARFGEPTPEEGRKIEGYHPRNAPWGSAAPAGEEHLTSLREPYLKSLAVRTGLGYHRLETARGLSAALQDKAHAEWVPARTDVRALFGGLALALLTPLYLLGLAGRYTTWKFP